jgi:hypothetical protein
MQDDDCPSSSACDKCAYCCGEYLDCDMTELLEDATLVISELLDETRSMEGLLQRNGIELPYFVEHPRTIDPESIVRKKSEAQKIINAQEKEKAAQS